MKKAYLTIDDAPSKDFKKKVNFLYKKKIPAIFFVTGHQAEKRENDLAYAVKKGFIIGNHSYSHPDFSKISIEEAKREIQKTDKIIEEIYKKAKTKRQIKLFRFPYGNKAKTKIIFSNKKSRAIQKYLRDSGFRQPKFENINYFYYKLLGLDKDTDTFWTFDIAEWKLKGNYDKNVRTIEDIINRINKSRRLKNKNSNNIILIHDQEQTTKYFEQIINKLLDKGIKFIKPDLN